MIAWSRSVGGNGNIALFAARGIGLPPSDGQHFLLNTGTLCILGYYREIP
jgi:probable phosphoglycerate mutase